MGMTNEEAIKWLENLKQDIGQLRHEDLWPYAQAIDEIIDMLDEQKKRNEPMKPTLNESHSYVSDAFKCGKCGHAIRFHAKYCEDCGQAVKWHDND